MSDSSLFQWVLLPSLIFLARVFDVSLDTMRIMFFSRGKRLIPPILGFIQALVWLLAIRQIIINLNNIACYLAFAGGFAMGTLIGTILEEKLAIGIQVIRLITRKDASELITVLKEIGCGVTSVDGQGSTGKVNIVYTIVKRSEVSDILRIIKEHNPKAFYTIEDIRSINEGVFQKSNR